MTDARTAAALCLHAPNRTFHARSLADLLSAVDDAYAALTAAYGAVQEPPVDPLMLNEDDLADEGALQHAVTALQEADAFPAPLAEGAGAAADRSLQVEQVERARPVFVELSGGPPLLLAFWLLSGLDGAYKVTEEYAVSMPTRQDVHKRVSFTTSASVPELIDAFGSLPD